MGDVWKVYNGTDGDATRALYARLFALGPAGAVAVNLLRVSKNSKGGKTSRYSGRGRRAAYESKDWAIGELCRELVAHSDELGIDWGWGYDAKAVGFEHVLYVEIPGHGQVSFHTYARRDGGDYGKEWDGVKDVSHVRIVGWAQFILNGESQDVERDRTARAAAQGAEGSPLPGGAGPAEGRGEGAPEADAG